ncbi:MAG: hypothetical protein C4332_06890 [Meiothermus sp.]
MKETHISKQPNLAVLSYLEDETHKAERLEATEPQLNRIQQFLKAKAANQHRPFGKDGGHKHANAAHTKLKERIRRRP